MTINKSHGQTFDKVGIYLSRPCFSHGQIYVAFSRARCSQDVRVLIDETPDQGKDKGRFYTKNPILRQVLIAWYLLQLFVKNAQKNKNDNAKKEY